MPSENNGIFWKKKEYISFVLSIFVLSIHSYFAQDIASGSMIAVINHKVSYFFSRSITQFAVPMFFIMSGITYFKGYNNKKYPAKSKSRVFTLVIPYLIWNTIWMIWKVLTSSVFGGEPYPLTLINLLEGVFFYGCNDPFWFIFDLIIFSFLAPVVFLIIRNKYIGIISIVCLSIVSLYGIHLPESVFYYPMSIVFYMMGALVGYHFFDFAAGKSSKPMQIASFVFLALYIIAKNITPQEIHINNYLTQTIVYTLAAFSLWNVADAFIERVKPRAIYGRSFAVYAMHLPLAIIVLKILSFCIPQTEWFEIPKFIIMVIATLTIINLACAFLEKYTPKIYSTLMGNRMKK